MQAGKFIPERWTTRPELIRNASAFNPFGLGKSDPSSLSMKYFIHSFIAGQHSCAGRALSFRILRQVIAQLVKKYEFSFAPGENGFQVHEDLADHFSATPGKLNLCIKIRTS